MKQIIERNLDGKILRKYYEDSKRQIQGLFINYGDLTHKTNCINDKKYGLDSDYYTNGKILQQRYHL